MRMRVVNQEKLEEWRGQGGTIEKAEQLHSALKICSVVV